MQQVVHPKPQPRQAMIAVIRYVEETDLVGPDAKSVINMKADFTEKPLLSSMFMKAQYGPSVRLHRFNLP
jgi:Mg2+/Co2+ transporter CorC